MVELMSLKIIYLLRLILSFTHVLKIFVQESDINCDSCFQKFWQIESSETKAKIISDYSKHHETSLPWKEHCE